MAGIRRFVAEGGRYLLAAAVALMLDMGIYSGLIRLAGVHYLIAAPCGFAAGLMLIYWLSVRWVFRHRRYANRRLEFMLFAAIGLAGLMLNELVIYVGVEEFALGYEIAKLISAGTVFSFNFMVRRALLFSVKEHA